MRLFKIIVMLIFLCSISNAQIFQIKEKWSLLGATEDIDISSVFDSSCMDKIFIYKKDKIWESYPRDAEFTSLKVGQGFWIYAEKPCSIDTKSSGNHIENSASYKLTFKATWSSDTHPENFPSNPHFSPLIGGLHNNKTNIWERGKIASPSVKIVAETGAINAMTSAMKNDKNIDVTVRGSLLSPSPKSKSIIFNVNKSHTYLSIISMLAPSPDWFIGVNSLNLLDENNNWIETKTIDLKLYDAGTDSGVLFNSANSNTHPQELIKTLTDETNTDFNDGKPFVGQFIITKQ